MTEVVSFDDLWGLSCESPECTHEEHGPLYLHSGCHPTKPTWARFEPEEGLIIITCSECDKEIIRIARP